MNRSLKTFIGLSLVIALLEISFVAFNYRQQQLTLEGHLQDKILQVRSSFDLALVSSRQKMSELASYVANFSAIQQTFLAGRIAVELEGGGPGGVEAEKMRDKLLTLSQGSWQELNSGFNFMQMHYHLPGKTTSFLRVHKPEKFGDLLGPFRHMLSEAHGKRTTISGLEIGRSGMFVRGVAPVFAYDAQAGRDVYVGSIEFATSLKQAIDNIALNQGVDIAVLLDVAHLKSVTWPDRLQEMLEEKGMVNNFLIAATSFPAAKELLEEEHFNSSLGPGWINLHEHEQNHHWLATFPLRDYWGEQNPHSPAVGQVLISSDETGSQQILKANLQHNIIIALLGFFTIEIFLWLALKLTAQKLEQLVVAGREQLEVKNVELEKELLAKEKLQQQRETLIDELLEALEDVKALSGLLPICSYCKKIRDDDGYWQRLEGYIESHSSAQFSHGICNDCLSENFPEVEKKMKSSALQSGEKSKET